MKWYTAKLVLKCIVDNQSFNLSTFDEQVRVIQAENSEDAYAKALKFGNMEEHQYTNSDGKIVRWVFCGLSNLEEILDEQIEDGTEITANLYELIDVSELVRIKEDLAVFWYELNKNKTARQLIRNRSHKAIRR